MIENKDIEILSCEEEGDFLSFWIKIGTFKIHMGKLKYGYTKLNFLDDLNVLKDNLNAGIILDKTKIKNKNIETIQNSDDIIKDKPDKTLKNNCEECEL